MTSGREERPPTWSCTIDEVAPKVCEGLRLLPIIHDRVDMASLVRWVLRELKPAGVAVELPKTFAPAVTAAVKRLPQISAVISEEPGEEALVWVAAPGDPFCEALRWAKEQDRPSWLIDPDIRYVHRHQDVVPDPHAMWQIGAARYLGTIAGIFEDENAVPEDLARERGMGGGGLDLGGTGRRLVSLML